MTPVANMLMDVGWHLAPYVTPSENGRWALWPPPPEAEHARTIIDRLMRLPPDRSAGVISRGVSWARCGFPQVVLGHKLAASLASTSAAGIDPSDLKLPWDTFHIVVPVPLITGSDTRGGSVPLVRIEVRTDPAGLCVLGELGGNSCAEINHPALTWTGMLNSNIGDEDPHPNRLPADAELTDHDKRALGCIGRLVVGVVLELDGDRSNVRSGSRPSVPRSGPPKVWTFQLVRSVRVDVRAAVQSFCIGEGKAPTVQSLVRGHHKRQVCGPGGSQRKWIHIEPYWRGPEDAPIAVRAHHLKGEA